MADESARAAGLFAGAIAFGLAAETLDAAVPARLDVALAIAALLLTVALLAQRGLVTVPRASTPLGVPFALLLVGLIWRDSATLFALNLLGLVGIVVLASPRLGAGSWSRAGAGDYLLAAGGLLLGAGTGMVPLALAEVEWRRLPAGGAVGRTRAAGIGVLAALPVTLAFGGLLRSADPAFDRIVAETLTLDLGGVADRLVGTAAWAWLAGGLLRALLGRPAMERGPRPAVRDHGRLGLLEVGTVLAAVDLLFLGFVLVQFRYLFGGTLVRELTGLSYAEYARRGFFELVWVAALSLPLLLLADWSLDQRGRTRARGFRALALAMLALLNVILASAMYRMRLYTAEYGLTELRLYTTAFMGWLVIVFGWLAATVLRGRRDRFASGALAAGYLVLVTLNLVNPDALVARTNLARSATSRPPDVEYLATSLSADAVPTLRAALAVLPASERRALESALRRRWRAELSHPRRWTIALRHAGRILGGASGPGAALAGPPSGP